MGARPKQMLAHICVWKSAHQSSKDFSLFLFDIHFSKVNTKTPIMHAPSQHHQVTSLLMVCDLSRYKLAYILCLQIKLIYNNDDLDFIKFCTFCHFINNKCSECECFVVSLNLSPSLCLSLSFYLRMSDSQPNRLYSMLNVTNIDGNRDSGCLDNPLGCCTWQRCNNKKTRPRTHAVNMNARCIFEIA